VEKESVLNNGHGTVTFLVGLSIGVGLGILLAPKSGEETREWIADTTQDQVKRLRRQGRRWVFQAQDALEQGQDTVTKILKNSRNALDTVASRL
jgi:gas vesicle protein